MSHAYPAVIATRLTADQAARVLRAANQSGLTPSAFARSLLGKLAAGATGSGDPADAIAAICKALGLAPDADSSVIQAAFKALLDTVNPADDADDGDPSTDTKPADPTAPGADSTPPPPGTSASLTKYEIDACAKRGMSPAEYIQAKASAVRSFGAPVRSQLARETPTPAKRPLDRQTRARLKAQGLSEDEFEQLKKDAVRRV